MHLQGCTWLAGPAAAEEKGALDCAREFKTCMVPLHQPQPASAHLSTPMVGLCKACQHLHCIEKGMQALVGSLRANSVLAPELHTPRQAAAPPRHPAYQQERTFSAQSRWWHAPRSQGMGGAAKAQPQLLLALAHSTARLHLVPALPPPVLAPPSLVRSAAGCQAGQLVHTADARRRPPHHC